MRVCSTVAAVTIPESVTSINKNAFANCSGLTSVTCLNPTPPTCTDQDVFNNVNKDQCRVYVPVGAGKYYKIAIAWRDFTYIEEKFSGVESTIADEVNVVVENGNIVVNGAEDANIEVYNTNGLCVYNGTDTNIAVNTKGLYIVRVNGKSFKVIL